MYWGWLISWSFFSYFISIRVRYETSSKHPFPPQRQQNICGRDIPSRLVICAADINASRHIVINLWRSLVGFSNLYADNSHASTTLDSFIIPMFANVVFSAANIDSSTYAASRQPMFISSLDMWVCWLNSFNFRARIDSADFAALDGVEGDSRWYGMVLGNFFIELDETSKD